MMQHRRLSISIFARETANHPVTVAAATAFAAFLIYLRTAAPSVLPGDSGEFHFAAWGWWIAHPTGYPLYLILGGLWQHLLPFGDPAFRLNIFSAFWSALAVGLGYLVFLRVADDRSSALITTLTFAVSPLFWSQATRAEVYALHTFFVVLLTLVGLEWRARPRVRYAAAFAVVLGLSLAHHRGTLLLLPAFAALFAERLWERRSHPLALIRRGLLYGALALVPLVLYLYIPARLPATPYAILELTPGYDIVVLENTPRGWLELVLGQRFQNELALNAQTLAMLLGMPRRLVAQFNLLGVALGILGFGALLWSHRVGIQAGHIDTLSCTSVGDAPSATPSSQKHTRLVSQCDDGAALHTPGRMGILHDGASGMGTLRDGVSAAPSLAAFVLFGLLSITLFNSVYHIGDIADLFTPAYFFFAILLAVGCAFVLTILEQNKHLRNTTLPTIALLALIAFLPMQNFFDAFPEQDRSRQNETRAQWEAWLDASLPENALLLSNDRDEMTPLWYLQLVENRRRDLLGLFPRIAPGAVYDNVVSLADVLVRSGRPVVAIKPIPALTLHYRMRERENGMQELIPGPLPPPQIPSDAVIENMLRVKGFSVLNGDAAAGETIILAVQWQPLKPLRQNFQTSVQIFDDAGKKVAQGVDHIPGAGEYPPSRWRVGEVVEDRFEVTIQPGLSDDEYTVYVRVYDPATDEGLGDLTPIGRLFIEE